MYKRQLFRLGRIGAFAREVSQISKIALLRWAGSALFLCFPPSVGVRFCVFATPLQGNCMICVVWRYRAGEFTAMDNLCGNGVIVLMSSIFYDIWNSKVLGDSMLIRMISGCHQHVTFEPFAVGCHCVGLLHVAQTLCLSRTVTAASYSWILSVLWQAY